MIAIGQVFPNDRVVLVDAVDHIGANVHVVLRPLCDMGHCVKEGRTVRFLHCLGAVRLPIVVGVHSRRAHVRANVDASHSRCLCFLARGDEGDARWYFLCAIAVKLGLPAIVVHSVVDRVCRVPRHGTSSRIGVRWVDKLLCRGVPISARVWCDVYPVSRSRKMPQPVPASTCPSWRPT